jgi:hypothetical protein
MAVHKLDLMLLCAALKLDIQCARSSPPIGLPIFLSVATLLAVIQDHYITMQIVVGPNRLPKILDKLSTILCCITLEHIVSTKFG